MRVRRRLITFASALSLVLGAVTVTLWMRSDGDIHDLLSFWYGRHQVLFLESYQGVFGIYVQHDHWTWVESADVYPPQKRLNVFTDHPRTRVAGADVWTHDFPGWGDLSAGTTSPGEDRSVCIGFTAPYWLAMIAFSGLPILAVTSRVRRLRQKRRGLCERCGYDLRASPERCPECGAPTPTSTIKP